MLQNYIFSPSLLNIFINGLDKGMERMVIKFASNTKLKGSTNVLYDRIKIQNDLDKAEHWDVTHKMKLTDMLWNKKKKEKKLMNKHSACVQDRRDQPW